MALPTNEVNTEEGWHTCGDGEKLYFKIWKTKDRPKARMILVHGFSDHCDTYGILFPRLATRGIEVFGFDQRGWGRSVKHPRYRGRSGSTSMVLADINSVLRRFIPISSQNTSTDNAPMKPLETPLFLYGHSMGGAEVLQYAAKYPSPYIRGYLVESPFIALDPRTQPFAITEIAGRMAAKVLPHFHMHQPLQMDFLTRDKESNNKMAADSLCHDYGTLEGLAGMLDRASELKSGKVRLDVGTSIWGSHGTGDQICAFEATKEWFEKFCGISDKTFKAYDGWYHRLHDELGEDKEIFAKDVADWILARS